MDDGKIAERKMHVENLRAEYQEVCQNHRAISEFRAKLLTLLPLASGTGIFLLLRKSDELLEFSHLGAIGVFGFVVTLGLFFHELRGIAQCGDLIQLGKSLEEKLGLGEAQFTLDYAYYNPRGISKFFHEMIGPVGAAWIIYPTVCLAWLYVAAVGFRVPLRVLAISIFGVVLFSVSVGAVIRWRKQRGSKA